MSDFKWRHFQGEIILWAVRWYCRYGISYRDLEQMMGERGIPVDHSTIYRWVQKYAPEIEKRLRWHWRRPQSVFCNRTLYSPMNVFTLISTSAWRPNNGRLQIGGTTIEDQTRIERG